MTIVIKRRISGPPQKHRKHMSRTPPPPPTEAPPPFTPQIRREVLRRIIAEHPGLTEYQAEEIFRSLPRPRRDDMVKRAHGTVLNRYHEKPKWQRDAPLAGGPTIRGSSSYK